MWFAGFVLLAVRFSILVGLVLVLVGLLVVTAGLGLFQRHLTYFLGDEYASHRRIGSVAAPVR